MVNLMKQQVRNGKTKVYFDKRDGVITEITRAGNNCWLFIGKEQGQAFTDREVTMTDDKTAKEFLAMSNEEILAWIEEVKNWDRED